MNPTIAASNDLVIELTKPLEKFVYAHYDGPKELVACATYLALETLCQTHIRVLEEAGCPPDRIASLREAAKKRSTVEWDRSSKILGPVSEITAATNTLAE